MVDIDLKQIHDISFWVNPIIGSLINLLAIYLVKTQTVKELRHYSQTLLQNCFIDLFANIIVFTTKMQVHISDTMLYFMIDGFLENVQQPWNMLFYILLLFAIHYNIISMAIPFYCRYRVFCK